MQIEQFKYDNKTVKWFAFATMLWGIVGMLVGSYTFPNKHNVAG